MRLSQITALGAFAAVALLACSGDRNNSKSKSSPNGNVQVDGKTSDDSVTDYRQADESVQIGGVNLTGAALSGEYQITATLINISGQKVLYSGTSASSSFSFRLSQVSGYVKIEVKSPDGSARSGILAPAFKDASAYMVLNATTSIASKLYEIIKEKGASGDQNARTILANYALSVSDLQVSAAAIKMTVDQQKANGQTAAAINLSTFAAHLAEQAAANYNKVASSMGSSEMAAVVSSSAYSSVLSSQAATVGPTVLAYRASVPEGSIDVAYKALWAFNTPTVMAAYQKSVDVYRSAATATAAAAQTTTVESSYASTYNSCSATPDSCVSSTWVPTPPPEVSYEQTSGSTSTTTTGSATTTGGNTSTPTIGTQSAPIGP
jgi:hypothetical protein